MYGRITRLGEHMILEGNTDDAFGFLASHGKRERIQVDQIVRIAPDRLVPESRHENSSNPPSTSREVPAIPLNLRHLNPTEQTFAKIKRQLRNAAARSRDTLWRAVGEVLDEI